MSDALNRAGTTERHEPMVTLRDVTNTLRRYGRWIATLTALSAALVGAALWQVPKRYLAEATLIVDLGRPAVANLPGGGAAPPQPGTVDPALLRSEVNLMRSEPVAREVIRGLRLDEAPEFRKPGPLRTLAAGAAAHADSLGLPVGAIIDWGRRALGSARTVGAAGDGSPEAGRSLERLVQAYQDRLTVANDGRSHLIEVSFLSQDPALAAQVVNAHVAAYLRWQTEMKREVGRAASGWLNKELEELQARVQAAEETIQKFREANQIVSTPAATTSPAAPFLRGDTVLAQRLAEINSQLTLASAERSAREARHEQARTLIQRREVDRVSEVGASLLVQRLRDQEAAVLRRAAELRNRLGSKHPDVLTVQAELQDLRNAIGVEIQRILEGLSNEVHVARAREADLRAQVAVLEQRSAQTARAEIVLRELEREATVNRTLYENLLAQRQVLGVQQGIQRPDVRVVSHATPPMQPASPKVLQSALIVAGVVGPLLTALAFAREFLFRGVRGVMDLEQATGLPCLGTVPLLPRRYVRKGRPVDAMDWPQSLFADSVRSVRAAVSLPKTLLITSAMPGEGKSTVSIALGRSLATIGCSVLLIDADLRRPSIAAAMGDDSSDGWLNDALDAGREEQAEAGPPLTDIWPVRVDARSGLHYLASREGLAAPQDVLASSAMHRVLERATREYDVVLVDSPPVLAVTDALILAPQAEATLLVARWRHTSQDAISLAVSQVARAGGRLIGAVLNQVDVERGLFAPNDPGAYRRHAMAHYYGAPSPTPPRKLLRPLVRQDRSGKREAA